MAFDLGTFMQRELKKTAAPTRNNNRAASGRASRRTMRGQAVLQAVGGFTNDANAIYAPPDHHMCVVVDHSKGRKADGTLNRL